MKEPEYNYKKIKCAAIKCGDKVISGYRHDDCYKNLGMFKEPEEKWADWIQGFIDLNNDFHTREEAAIIAFEQGQIKEKTEMLFSEDLY